jgi:hypothetical protein
VRPMVPPVKAGSATNSITQQQTANVFSEFMCFPF